MSIIEQATKRLEELRRAGIEIPPMTSEASAPNGGARLKRSDVDRPGSGAAVVSLSGQQVVATHTPAAGKDTSASEAFAGSRYAEIDLDRLAAQGYLTPKGARGPLEDEIRIIKMQIVRGLTAAAAVDQPANVIVVSSAVPGEGKTFFSMNLAMSVAMGMDLSVVLVDADVLRPSVADRYGVPVGPGLLDLLTNPTLAIGDVLFRTNVPKLFFIQAGTPNPKSAELLAGNAAERLLTDLASRFSDSLVIFDAPPLLVSTEARQLAANAGQVVVVIEADKTDARLVSQAFGALADCPVVSSVLNRCPGSPAGAGYGYYGV